MPNSKVKEYFPSANSYLGFYSLWDSNINDLEKLIILKGGPGTGKSTLLSNLAQDLLEQGYTLEKLRCSSDADSLDGIVCRELSLGVIDGTAPHTRDPLYPGIVDKIINLGDYWDEQILQRQKDNIIKLTDENRALFKQTYALLAEAKSYHNQLEELHKEGMNWAAADALIYDLINKLFAGYSDSPGGKEIHRFAGAIAPQGTVSYLDDLLADAKIRYIIKGRAGTGKSTLARKIGAAAQSKGLDVEYYHCSFDPHSIDNIFIPQLGVCFIDGTPPHEKIPGPNDIVIDMFSFMSGAIYSKNQDQIIEMDEKYQAHFNEALKILKRCKAVHDELEACYIRAMDFKALDQLTQRLKEEIQAYATSRQ